MASNTFPTHSLVLLHHTRTFYKASQVSTSIRKYFSIPAELSTTDLQFTCMLVGSLMQNDGLESKSTRLQERICLRAFAHIIHRTEGHRANMGLSPLCLEGSSASCSPRLPTALHSATANDGLWQKFTGHQAMCLLQTAVRR